MKKYGLVLVLVVGAIAVVLIQARSPQSTTKTITMEGSHDHSEESHAAAGMVSGKILETMDAGGYTYVLVDTGKDKVWAAGPPTEVAVGAEVSFPTGMEMTGFKSESLNRTFDSIYFVGSLDTGVGVAGASPASGMPSGHPPVTPPDADVDFSGIKAAAGGQTIAALYAEKARFVGKEVVVRGKVTKFTSQVMGKNWVHLGDGSATGEAGDLTVTTQDVVKVGDVVVVRGTLGADKDFGYGYQYKVLVEDAKVTVE